MSKAQMLEVAERMKDIDKEALDLLGDRKVDRIMVEIRNTKYSLREVASRNGVSTGTVVQVARFHRIDPVTLENYG